MITGNHDLLLSRAGFGQASVGVPPPADAASISEQNCPLFRADTQAAYLQIFAVLSFVVSNALGTNSYCGIRCHTALLGIEPPAVGTSSKRLSAATV
jgi:hypothetical protein